VGQIMPWKKHSAEEIFAKLGRVRAAVDSGVTLSQAITVAGISEATYFRWRSQFGSMSLEQMRDLWRQQRELARERRIQLAEQEEAPA
jgi:putative transposase